MKIVYIYPTLAVWGGVERILVDKMNELARFYDYEIYVLTYNQGNHPVPYCLDNRVHHCDLKVRTHVKYSYRGFRRLWEGYKLQKMLYHRLKSTINTIVPDVIVTTTSGEISLLLKIKGLVPLLVESHGGYDHLVDFSRMTMWHRYNLMKIRQRLKRVDAIATLTESDARKWRNDYDHVYVIPNIAHLNPIGIYSSCKEKRILFVGRFAEQKGIPELLSVWSLVNKRHPEWLLDMYGQGGQDYFTQKHPGVNIYEPTADIFDKYAESSMLILTSRWEPFGLVIPEAMSCGLPVVSFEGDGPCQIITDGHDGFIVKNRDKQEMANRICELIENEDLRQQMSRNAIRTAQRYSSENIMPMWKNLFESLVNKKS